MTQEEIREMVKNDRGIPATFRRMMEVLIKENEQLEHQNKLLKEVYQKAKGIDEAFEYIKAKQNKLLGHGLKEACENWDVATNEFIDFEPLKQALKEAKEAFKKRGV